jgi:hypothetical protein
MSRQLGGPAKFKDSIEIIASHGSEFAQGSFAQFTIIAARLLACAGGEWRKVGERCTEGRAGLGANRGAQIRREVAGEIIAHADDELALALLRYTERAGILDLLMDAIAGAPSRSAETTRLVLHRSEVLPAIGRPQTENVLHHEDPRLEEIDVTQEVAEELPTRVIHQSVAMIGTVHLARSAEALARRPAHDDIHALSADDLREVLGMELREVFLTHAVFTQFGEVCAVGRDGLLVEINRPETLETGALHPKGEAAAPAKEVEKGRGAHARTPAQSSSMPTPKAQVSLSTALMPGLRTPRSIPLR